jgi:hypothetical protein
MANQKKKWSRVDLLIPPASSQISGFEVYPGNDSKTIKTCKIFFIKKLYQNRLTIRVRFIEKVTSTLEDCNSSLNHL